MTLTLYSLVILICHSVIPMLSDTDPTFTIGTWNSFDVYYGGDRTARRDYVFSNMDSLFGDLDFVCTQEAHTFASIDDYSDAFADLFPHSFYKENPSLSDIACDSAQIASFLESDGVMFECAQSCAVAALPGSIFGFIFCVWDCFAELRDPTTSITNRTLNPTLFDFGETFELSACLVCLWKSYYVNQLKSVWSDYDVNSTDAVSDVYDICGNSQPFDYKPNEGIILWSKYAFESVQFVEIPEAVFIPRGAIIATVTDPIDVTIICTHFETPTFALSPFTTMRQFNIDNGVTELANITQLDVAAMVDIVKNTNGNVIVLGDLNIGINSRQDIYDNLLNESGLKNVFGSDEELDVSVQCTRCADNPYTPNNEIVDHILVKGLGENIEIVENTAMKFMTGTYNTSVGNIPLSDHYGVKVTLKAMSQTTTDQAQKIKIWAVFIFVIMINTFFV